MSIETVSTSGFGSKSLSELFKLGKMVSKAIVGRLAADAADMSAHIGETHDVWWQPDGRYYPAVISKVEVDVGLVIVQFVESNSEQDRTFAVSPSAIKLVEAKSAHRVYSKA
ncbi:hypothetical protein [Yersinia ruckeri]|uniref:hypothetical protein n=1 Tax=Yersinia ruckeri TaxID=29486 RepID=UPI00223766E1|nr:hypothetical protein [Yersinia ruckeri]MCW6598718.1 hypothetical protein [Yersinia ruckeri]